MERVLDTSMIIALARDDKKVLDYLTTNHKNTTFYITAVTRFELKCGKTKEIEDHYINMLKALPFDDKSADVASFIYKELSKKGKMLSIKDLFVAAICIASKIPIVTMDRDFRAFKEFGLDLELI